MRNAAHSHTSLRCQASRKSVGEKRIIAKLAVLLVYLYMMGYAPLVLDLCKAVARRQALPLTC
jgi:hypothetical protein